MRRQTPAPGRSHNAPGPDPGILPLTHRQMPKNAWNQSRIVHNTNADDLHGKHGCRKRSSKIAENPALMPHIMAIFLSFSHPAEKLYRSGFPGFRQAAVLLPPRPTEAVARWLSRVEIKISGAVAGVTSSVEEIESRTISVPRFFFMRKPVQPHDQESDKRKQIQRPAMALPESSRFLDAKPNRVPARPIVTPEIAEMKVHFKNNGYSDGVPGSSHLYVLS